jgi:hypothetical protein
VNGNAIDEVPRIRMHPTEIKVRLGLVIIPRVKPETVRRLHIAMVDVPNGQAAAGSAVPIGWSGLCWCQQFSGSERTGQCEDHRAYDASQRNHCSRHLQYPSVEPGETQHMLNCVRRQHAADALSAAVGPLSPQL